MPRDPRPARASTAGLTRRGFAFLGGAIVCGIVAYSVGRSQLLYGLCFLALLPLIGLLLVRARPLRLTVTRTFSPTVVTAGSPTSVQLDVRNVSAFSSAPAVWTDTIPWGTGTAGPGSLPALPPSPRGAGASTQKSATLGYSLRPTVRGVYEIGPLRVEYTDPFGLIAGKTAVGGIQSLYVIPEVVPLGDGGPIHVSGDGSARLIQRMATGSDDDLMTREYRTGDALRRVHWRASARHGELMVRQEEQRSYPEARILIDTRADGYGDEWAGFDLDDIGTTWFEWSIRMVASLGVHLHRSGFLVQVVETAPRQIAPLGDANQGSGQDFEFLLSLAGLALLEPHSFTEPGLPGDGAEDRAQGVLGPIFAVIADPSPVALRWIIAQRRAYESGVAFVLGTGTSRAWDSLVAAGWTCVPVRVTDDPAAVWSSAQRFSASTVPEHS